MDGMEWLEDIVDLIRRGEPYLDLPLPALFACHGRLLALWRWRESSRRPIVAGTARSR